MLILQNTLYQPWEVQTVLWIHCMMAWILIAMCPGKADLEATEIFLGGIIDVHSVGFDF